MDSSFRLGQYDITEEIGRGGMATVYKAYQPSVNRYVAVKILKPETSLNANFIRRFETEAKAIASLEHPHILPLYDFGSQSGTFYMVMRLIDGGTLADLIDQGEALAYNRVVKIVSDIAGALDYAHLNGVVHRDVKPRNILIDHFNEVFLADFGIAKMIHGSDSFEARITDTGQVVGTAGYLAPERAIDEPLDGRSDVYSLGVVLFEMLAGCLPYDANTPMALALKHVQDPIPSLSDFNPDVPPSFEAVVCKAMAKEPDQRFQTAGELAQALQAALAEDTSGAPPSVTVLPVRGSKDSKLHQQPTQPAPQSATTSSRLWWIAGGIVIFSLAIMVGIFWLWLSSTSPPADSVLNNVAVDSQTVRALGALENRYPRSNYSRQQFAGGVMLWWDNLDGTDRILVIFNPQQAAQGNNWAFYEENWTTDKPRLPPSCPEAVEPNGPVMGFGETWCDYEELRNNLGLPRAPEEFGHDSVVEEYTGGVVLFVPVDQIVWVLLYDGSWQKLVAE